MAQHWLGASPAIRPQPAPIQPILCAIPAAMVEKLRIPCLDPMTRTPVKSSNLKSIGYDPKAGTLEVEFHSGQVHSYAKVPAHVHQGLLNAKSPGAYFHAHIRGGGYKSAGQ